VVRGDGDDTHGKIEFRDPANPAKPLLNFDPRGQLIEILEAGAPIFSVNFPNAS